MAILKRFFLDRRGNVAMMFSLAIVGIIGIVGLAVDYSRANSMQVRIAAAVDTAVLAGGRAGGSETERIAVAKKVFDAALGQLSGTSNIVFTPQDVVEGGKVVGFKAAGSVRLSTVFGKLYGQPHFDIGLMSQAILGVQKKLELALVLDSTGSMSGAKIATLKTAAKGLVTALTDKVAKSDQVKISLVPFAQYVNVGLSHRNEPWLMVANDSTETNNVCKTTTPILTSTNCVTTPYTYTSNNDGVITTHTSTKKTCDKTYGPPVTTCQDVTTNHVWNGCVGSRNHPFNTMDDTYHVHKIPGLMDRTCQASLIPLTNNVAQLHSAIDAMNASGKTYIPSGLIWGWRTLSPAAPFSESVKGGADPLKQVVVLMTDGANTLSASYPDHTGSNIADANSITSTICQNMKKPQADIVIYTIAFEVTDPAIKSILQSCATIPVNYYDATNAMQLAAAFDDIAKSLTALRLEK